MKRALHSIANFLLGASIGNAYLNGDIVCLVLLIFAFILFLVESCME